MDDTHHSRTSDAAAATRKRRSSILKSQRPPRTPFSELEFNVATPTDATKSRRVSFSRRTGVAEFITNEATTTWKNFYEEQNKSLESSGNESGANAPRPIGHIGKRFDQLFEDVEAVEFGSALDNHPNRNINTSINNANFIQQLASLECTVDDRKLSVPQQNFEMSAFTDHQSKLFGDDLAIPIMGEMSGRIDVNFSAVQTIGEVKDDLDEIQKDLQRALSNGGCPGPFAGRRSMSEYIEVDLNATHVSIKNDANDMSITDTIHSPKVQDVSKSHSSIKNDSKVSFSKDWVADKENIVINPYVTPKESTNFAINDESDKILVFDGKRLTVHSDKEAEKILTDDLKPTLPKEPKAHKRKTIVLNTNDDLPNFFTDPQVPTSHSILSSASFKYSVVYNNDDDLPNENNFLRNQKRLQGNDTGNISITQAIPSNILLRENTIKDSERSKTDVYEDAEAEISMTEVLPSKIIGSQENFESHNRRTIIYENDIGNISITRAIPANIILNEGKVMEKQKKEPEKIKTILFDNEMSNISITQAIPANILVNEQNKQPERRKTIVYDDDMGNISMTRAIPANIILNKNKEATNPERRRTILYDNDMGNISVTQAIPASVILNKMQEVNQPESERRKTIVYDDDMGDISMTQAIPANIIINENKEPTNPERRKTILYDNDIGNISMTQAIPESIILNKMQEVNKPESERRRTIVYDDDMGDISMTQAIPANIILNENKDTTNPERRKTILCDNDMGNISMTQAIPARIILNKMQEVNKPESERRRTIVYDDDMGDISMTQAIPANIILNDNKEPTDPERRKTILYDNDIGNISMTQAIPARIILNKMQEVNKPESERRRTIVYDDNMADISMTQAIPANIILNDNKEPTDPERRKTILYDNDIGNISMTQAIPASIIFNKMQEVNKPESERRRTIVYDDDMGDISMTQAIPANIILNENKELNKPECERRRTVVYDDDMGEVSITQVIPANIIFNEHKEANEPELERRRTILYDNDIGNISVTQASPAKIIAKENKDGNEAELQRRRTILYDNNTGNISMTQSIPPNILVNRDVDKSKTILYEKIDADIISVTQDIPTNLLISNNSVHEDCFKRQTIVFESEDGNLSVSLPSKLLEPEKRKIINYGIDSLGNISITQAIPANIITNDKSKAEDEKRSSVYDSNVGNVTINQGPAKEILPAEYDLGAKINIVSDSDTDQEDISTTSTGSTNTTLSREKSKSILREDEANVSNISNNIFTAGKHDVSKRDLGDSESDVRKIPTSHTVPNSILLPNGKRKILYDSNALDTTVTQAVLVNVLLTETAIALAETSKAPEEDKDSETGNLSDVQDPPAQKKETSPESSADLTEDDKPPVEDDRTSSDGLIYIIRDTNDETQTDKPNKSLTWTDDVPKIQHSPLSLEYKEDVDAEASADLPKKLNKLKSLITEKSSHANIIYENIVSSDLEKDTSQESESDLSSPFKSSIRGKSFKDANDTDELLEMLSNLSESSYVKEPKKPVEKMETIEPKRVIIAPNRSSVISREDLLNNVEKIGTNEPRRVSIAPNRSSVISREDLLNNISMAQAALQRSPDTDESIHDTTSDTPREPDLPTKKSVRMSNEVVKKLQFEDESASDSSIKSDLKSSPLKKTAFGEISYLKEKTKVIPSYLKYVSDEIKALMNDLVKPSSDLGTYNGPSPNSVLKNASSTCSTQIQANLVTSSQIDLETELASATDSGSILEKESKTELTSATDSGFILEKESTCSVDTHESSNRIPQEFTFNNTYKKPISKSPSQERVIVFDPVHPLNNVLLVPIDFSHVHRYNPQKSNEMLCTESQLDHSAKEADSEVLSARELNSDVESGKDVNYIKRSNERFVGSVTVVHSMHQSGDSVPDKYDAQSLLSNKSKPHLLDEALSAVNVCKLKDIKLNTIIAMKGNEELLDTSSSLTLVDDALARSSIDMNLETSSSSITNSIVYSKKSGAILKEKLESESKSTVEINEPVKMKGNKRNYSPTKKHNNIETGYRSLDVTPKPAIKMQKMSNSPKNASTEKTPEKLTAEKDENVRLRVLEDRSSDDKSLTKERKHSCRKKSPKHKKPLTTVTIQQLLTQNNTRVDINQGQLKKKIIESLSRSDSSTSPYTVSLTDVESKCPALVNSFTSSKNPNEMFESSSKTGSSRMDWQSDAAHAVNTGIASECDSSVNVVAKINTLPFMGSSECEWETSSSDTWSFRLLYARLRLSVRLGQRQGNATLVRPDTPVQHVALGTTHEVKNNSVSILCVNFAAETMRYFIGRGCSTAGDVPALLRRCASVARVAQRWARAMQEARVHLAYTLSNDGFLALKVANIPLRSVWEVTMRLELVVEDAREVPWPRASDVRVSRVVADFSVSDDEVKRALAHLPRDWGHAPRTVWKIFRYLKSKTREGDLLGF